MKFGKRPLHGVELIDSYLAALGSSEPSYVPPAFYTDSMKEFWSLRKVFEIPEIGVKTLSYDMAGSFSEGLIEELGAFLVDHQFMEKRRPASEEHSLHFVRGFTGKVIDLVHIIRLDFRFTPDSGKMVSKGSTVAYPAYETDRVFFKSRIVPVVRGSEFSDIEAVRLSGSSTVEADGRLFTSVVFDEGGFRKKSLEYVNVLGKEFFKVSVNIYQPLCFDYFTLCLNVPVPTISVIEKSLKLFEPLFLYYCSIYGMDEAGLSDQFKDVLIHDGGVLNFTPEFREELHRFFKSYDLVADNEMVLQGIKKLEMNPENH